MTHYDLKIFLSKIVHLTKQESNTGPLRANHSKKAGDNRKIEDVNQNYNKKLFLKYTYVKKNKQKYFVVVRCSIVLLYTITVVHIQLLYSMYNLYILVNITPKSFPPLSL